jgi:hypothetical protein
MEEAHSRATQGTAHRQRGRDAGNTSSLSASHVFDRPLTALFVPLHSTDLNQVKNPIFRCVQREFNSWNSLLKRVTGDMSSVVAVSESKEKATNPIRELFKTLRKDKLPKGWSTPTSKELSVPAWAEDFARRIEHMQKVASTAVGQYPTLPIWLGGFFAPEAFVAATRQAVAQAHGWSLETLHLKVTVDDKSPPSDSFTFEGTCRAGMHVLEFGIGMLTCSLWCGVVWCG